MKIFIDTFEQLLREEFLINTHNYPKEYHKLFLEKFERAEKAFKEQFPEDEDIYDSENVYLQVVEMVEKDNIQCEFYKETIKKLKDKFIINRR